MIKTARIFAFVIGSLTVLWQVLQVVDGNFRNLFFPSDLLLGVALMITALLKPSSKNLLLLLAAYAFSAGVFATATLGGILVGSYDFGAFTTTVALVPCFVFLVLLAKDLNKVKQLA